MNARQTTITKKPTTSAGPQAALARLDDARTLLTTISAALEREHAKRTSDLDTPRIGWRYFGDAARVLEELKTVADALGIERNEVAGEHACPGCGTRDADRLALDENDVHCAVCGCEYTID
jgi:hypothetical protein